MVSPAKHTPGPWALYRSDRSPEFIVNQAHGPGYVATLPMFAHRAEECAANAALITSAPLLLRALRAARTWMASDCESFVECHTGPAGLDQIATDAVASYRRMLEAMDAAIAAAEMQA